MWLVIHPLPSTHKAPGLISSNGKEDIVHISYNSTVFSTTLEHFYNLRERPHSLPVLPCPRPDQPLIHLLLNKDTNCWYHIKMVAGSTGLL